MQPQQSTPSNVSEQPVGTPQNAGTPQAAPIITPNNGMTKNKVSVPRWAKITLIVIAVLIIFGVGVTLFTNQSTKNAAKVSNQFVADVQADNVNAAYNLTTPSFKQATSSDSLAQLLSRLSPILLGNATITGKAINKSAGQPDLAVIVYVIKTNAGNKYLRVVLQDNHPWQVLNFRSSDTPLSSNSTN